MKLIKSVSFKNVFKISTGTVVGQLISIVSLPFISRMYGVTIIGIWALINSYASIITNISDLGLTQSIMICNKKKISKIYSVISLINFLISILSGIVLFIYFWMIHEEISNIFLVVLWIIIYSIELTQINLLNTILNRDKKYNILMFNTIIRFGSVSIIAIVLGYMGFVENGYFIANIFGQAITAIFLLFHTHFMFSKIDLNDIISVIKDNLNFVKFQMPNATMVTIRAEIPNILIGSLFGNEVLGCFAVAQKLLSIPIFFLGQSIGKVFYQKTSEMKRHGENIGQFVNKSINLGMIVAVIPMLLFASFGDAFTTFYFGQEYALGGVLCKIIAFREIFYFISVSVQGIEIVTDKQHYVFLTSLCQTILSVISVLLGYYIFDSIYITVLLIVITFIFVQIIYFCRIYNTLNLRWTLYLRNIFTIIIIMIIGMIILRKFVINLLLFFNSSFSDKLVGYFVDTIF